MFKCKECGLEYNTKPDYCDCGNDEFEEIANTPILPNNTDEIKQEQVNENNKIENIENKIHSENIIQKQNKRTFSEQYPEIAGFLSSIDLISGIFFIICLLLSVYVIMFAWNQPETTTVQEQNPKITTSKTIPPIDKFWDNTLPKQTETNIKKENPEIAQQTVKEIIQTIQPQPQKSVKPSSMNTTSKQQAVKSTTAQKAPVKAAATKKTTPIAVQKNNNVKQQNTNPIKQSATSSTPVQKTTTQPVQEVKPVVQQKTPAEIAAEQAIKAQKAAQLKAELSNYKVQLRNTIGRKIDFTKVVGDGSCTVAFKINSAGKLVNRSFAKQSSNITLNDAVYAAVMATPTFQPPPSAYNNETMNLNISFYNGNFEITLK